MHSLSKIRRWMARLHYAKATSTKSTSFIYAHQLRLEQGGFQFLFFLVK